MMDYFIFALFPESLKAFGHSTISIFSISTSHQLRLSSHSINLLFLKRHFLHFSNFSPEILNYNKNFTFLKITSHGPITYPNSHQPITNPWPHLNCHPLSSIQDYLKVNPLQQPYIFPYEFLKGMTLFFKKKKQM